MTTTTPVLTVRKKRAHGREFFIYAVYKLQLSLQLIHDDYRLRFCIESSYRMKNQCRIKTTIKNPIIRFLFVALSFLIVNVWIYSSMALSQSFKKKLTSSFLSFRGCL
jgi:IS4 transposase